MSDTPTAAIDRWTNDIHQGDAAETLAEMPENSVHMAMCSPPYFGLRDYGVEGQIGLEDSLDEYIEELVAVADELRRVLRDDGSWWLNLGDSFGNKQKMMVPHRVAIALQDSGWVIRSDAVWAKPNPMPHPVKDRLHEHKEFIFHLTPDPDYWFDLDPIREPHQTDDPRVTDGERWESDTEKEKGGQQQSFADVHPRGKNPGDIFEVTTKPFPDGHFAVFPPELVEVPIESSCPPKVCAECGTPYTRVTEQVPMWERDPSTIERTQTRRALEIADEEGLTDEHFEAARSVGIGNLDGGEGNPYERVNEEKAELAREAAEVLGSYYREALMSESAPTDEWVQPCDCDTGATEPGIALDPFAGAGTTALVAKELGRRFIGTELNPEYVAMAQKRVGVTVDEPERLLEDGETSITAYADGGRVDG